MYIKVNSYLYEQNKPRKEGYLLICLIHLEDQEDPEEVYLKCLGYEEELVGLSAVIEMKLKGSITKAQVKDVYAIKGSQKPQAVDGEKFLYFFDLVKRNLK